MELELSERRTPRVEREKSEEIVDRILDDAVVSVDKKRGLHHFLLYYGSKILDVYFNESRREYMTIVQGDQSMNKLTDETSLLYKAARVLMNTRVNKDREAATYALITENKKMINWAQSEGEKIFHWDERGVEHTGGGIPTHKFVANIDPLETRTPPRARSGV